MCGQKLLLVTTKCLCVVNTIFPPKNTPALKTLSRSQKRITTRKTPSITILTFSLSLFPFFPLSSSQSTSQIYFSLFLLPRSNEHKFLYNHTFINLSIIKITITNHRFPLSPPPLLRRHRRHQIAGEKSWIHTSRDFNIFYSELKSLFRSAKEYTAFSGFVALICANGYIVGINQIYDIGIDKVNKPYLPIAAGDISVQLAWFLVLSFAVVGVIIVGMDSGRFITPLYCLALFLGTIYSVPPLRMKRFPVLAFLIIATVRGFLLNFGVYYSVRATLGLTFQWRLILALCFTLFVT